MNTYVVYPAVFNYDGTEISVEFPDLGVATSGIDDQDALDSAKELLGIVLCGLEEDNEPIPDATPLKDIVLAPNEQASLVEVFMPAVRLREQNKSVSRTVTLPAWLNAAAQAAGLNYSQILQDGLKQKLAV